MNDETAIANLVMRAQDAYRTATTSPPRALRRMERARAAAVLASIRADALGRKDVEERLKAALKKAEAATEASKRSAQRAQQTMEILERLAADEPHRRERLVEAAKLVAEIVAFAKLSNGMLRPVERALVVVRDLDRELSRQLEDHALKKDDSGLAELQESINQELSRSTK